MRKYLIGLGVLFLFIVVVVSVYGKNPKIKRVSDEEAAQKLGYSLEMMDEDAVVILNKDNKVYVLSPKEEGIERAVAYMKKNLTGNGGKILLAEGEDYADPGVSLKKQINIGQTPIDTYKISYSSNGAVEACEELKYYIQQTCNDVLDVVPHRKAGEYFINLDINRKLGNGNKDFRIEDGRIYISAGDGDALLDAVYLFTDTYLGWMKAGEEEAHISSVSSVLNVPANVTAQNPWIEEREAIVCLWNVNYPRGVNLNEDVSTKNNILDFSEDQIYEYVKMLKYCGFTGVQVTEMCSAWAGVDNYETVHDLIRTFSEAAHSLDMKFTLWVWGAEFEGYSWVDNSVSYDFDEYVYQHLNPEVVDTFEKYYSIYAELADCCDRVIAHYYDPGNLFTAETVGFFAKMLKDKMQALNPEIDFGVSCWVDAFEKDKLVEIIGNDVTLYESGHHDRESDYTTFRNQVAAMGCRLGTWAWNTCEMEIDQMAQMNFNMDIIRSVYHTARNYDGIMKPSYWSEMDSYHVLNVFSLYCAGQMLINPDIPSETLYENISIAAVGEEYAEAFAQMLSIIQDARSGSSWDQYWWAGENYILKSEAYPAEEILSRCEQYIPVLQEMIDKGIETNTLPLPISLNDVLRLMLPHLRQIQEFAEFRIALGQLEKEYETGVSIPILARKLEKISDPIKPYTAVIGVWGQIEARAQLEMIAAFCEKTGVPAPDTDVLDEQRKDYIYSQLVTFQKSNQHEPYAAHAPYYQWGVAYGVEETERLVEEMVQEGLLIRNRDGSVSLVDWENYIYHFD